MNRYKPIEIEDMREFMKIDKRNIESARASPFM